jgi:hypothetical protein
MRVSRRRLTMTTKPMTDEEIRAIRERLAARTPGKWSTSVLGPPDEDWPEAMAIAATYGRQKIYACAGGSFPKADQEFIAAAPTDIAALLAEVERLTQERDEARAEVVASDERLVAVMDGTFSVGDGTAQREIERLRAELESLAPHARGTASEPDAEVLAAPVRCDCCSVVIPAGDSAVMFEDEAGRECWAHYARCPEPEMWRVEFRCTTCSPGGRDHVGIPRPLDEAQAYAASLREAGVARVRLVRVRKEVTSG